MVTLPDNFPDISRRTSTLPLKVDVCYEDELSQFDSLDRNFDPNLFEVISNTNIDRSRRGLVTLKLNEASANHNNRKFVVRFMAFTLEGDLNSVFGYSIPLTVVRYRLKIQEEFSEHGSYIWMKDVGGKDKSIDLNVSLVDTSDKVVLNRRVPLRVRLLYSNGAAVPQQDILHLSPDSQLVIGANGSARIKCRINEVSSRHQGQLFQVLVSPDFELPSSLADISPCRSVPVEVKSKINYSIKRKLQAMGEMVSPTASNALDGGYDHAEGESNASTTGTKVARTGIPYVGGTIHGPHGQGIPAAGANPLGQNIIGVRSGYPAGINVVGGNTRVNASADHSILPVSSVLSHSSRNDISSSSNAHSVNNISVSSVGGSDYTARSGLAALSGAAAGREPYATVPQTVRNGTAASSTSVASAAAGKLPLVSGMQVDTSAAAAAAASVLTAAYFRYQPPSALSPSCAHYTDPSASVPAPVGGATGYKSVGVSSGNNNFNKNNNNNNNNNNPSSIRGPSASSNSALRSPAARALQDLVEFADLAIASIVSMQWVPIGQIQNFNPETGLPLPVTADHIQYSMVNPNLAIAALADK